MDKAYIRTLEMFIAVVITFIFMIFIISRNISGTDEKSMYILDKLEQDNDFRNCVTESDVNCVNSSVFKLIPVRYNYTLTISDNLITPENLPLTKISVDSIMIKGNLTNSTTKFVQIFYWKKI